MIGAVRDPRSEAPPEEPGTTAFGKYQLFASLGRGGMADVFLSVARGQMGFNKLAVIKRLRTSLAGETAFRNMFLDEARLAARLNHPNIVHTYEVGEQDGVYFIAMEYLEGQSLNKVLKEALRRKRIIEPEIAVRIVADALAGLGHAHELRDYDGQPLHIIHRDVSPHNLFVTYEGHTKLVDFGIAKAALSSTETEVGVLKGKVAYMSPEQAMGKHLDGRSDLFAMGIVLWELLTRRRLMTGANAASTLHKLMSEPIPRLSEILPNVDPVLDMLVARALEKDPNARWQSAAEMRDALESWAAAHPHPARQEDVSRTMLELFGSAREEVQRHVQKHMATLTAASNTQELQALTAESLERMAKSGANVSGQLLRLGTSGSGSGSGVVASYGGLSGHPAAAPTASVPSAVAPSKANSPLAIVIAIGFFVLAGLLIVVVGLRDRGTDGALAPDAPAAGNAAATVGAAAPPSDPPAEAPASAPPAESAPAEPATAEAVAPAAKASLAPKATTAPKATAASSPSPATPVRQRHVPAARPVVAPKPAAPPPVPAEEPGFLTVTSYPWAKVTEGGRVICAVTPCNKVQMSPGTHTLTFEKGESPGQKQSVSVQVKTGETATKAVSFN